MDKKNAKLNGSETVTYYNNSPIIWLFMVC
jgi:hypothetical protein